MEAVTYGGGVNPLHRKQVRKQRNVLLADGQTELTPVATHTCGQGQVRSTNTKQHR